MFPVSFVSGSRFLPFRFYFSVTLACYLESYIITELPILYKNLFIHLFKHVIAVIPSRNHQSTEEDNRLLKIARDESLIGMITQEKTGRGPGTKALSLSLCLSLSSHRSSTRILVLWRGRWLAPETSRH